MGRAAVVAFAIVAACGLAFVRGGHVQSDEGWYLTAARAVFEGRLPYRDFMYTQGPVHPYLYGIGQKVFGAGLAAGRMTSWVLFLAAIALAALTARRRGGGLAALFALALIGSASMTYWVWSLPLTHASAGCFLTLGIFLLTHPSGGGRREVAGLVAIAIGAAIRVSLVGALACAVLWIGLRRRSPVAVAWAAAVAILSLAVLMGPFALASPENFRFGLWDYHAMRTRQFSASPLPVPAAVWWQGKGVFLLEVARNYSVLALAGLGAILVAARGGSRPAADAGRSPAMFVGTVVIVTLAISMIPHPVHVTYAGILVPPAAAIAASALAAALRESRFKAFAPHAAGVALAGLAVAAWVFAGRCDPGELARVRQAAAAIDRALPPGPIHTFQNLITAENGRPLLPGLEMGPFAFWPFATDAEAARRHVLNAAGLCARIRSREAVAIVLTLRERGQLTLPCGGERLGEVLLREYAEVPALRVEGFGQYGAPANGGDVLYVLERRAGPP